MQHDSLSAAAHEHRSPVPSRRGDSTSSVFHGIVPHFLQRRLSPIRSLRYITSTYIRPASHQRQHSTSSNTSDVSTPPPPYSEDPQSDEDDMDAEFASAPSSRPSSSGSVTPNTSHLAMTVGNQAQFTDDLVRFKFANQGLLLVAQSAQELRTNPNANNEYQRRLYLDGVAYLLRALPEGLTESEKTALQSAMPSELRDEDPGVETIGQKRQSTTRHKSALSGTISLFVFWAFFAFATALPYFRILVRSALTFERKHKLGEQSLNRALALMQITYTQMLAIVCAVWAYNDGMVGQKLTELGVWCAENVGDGVRDGLREAAAALRRTQDDR